MRIYAVQKSYDNGESYEDNYWYDNMTIVLCATEQRAKEYIAEIELPKDRMSKEKWIEGEPYPNCPTECIRQFYCKRCFGHNVIEHEWYTIREMEVFE